MPHGETLLIEVAGESWPLASPFVIARGAKLEANVIVAIVSDGHVTGRGEAVPYARYGETVEASLAALRALPGPIDRSRLPGPAAARSRAQRARLRALGPRGQAGRKARVGAGRAPSPATRPHLLHLEPRRARSHGGGSARRPALEAPQAQARRRRRPSSAWQRCGRHVRMHASSPMQTRPGRRRCWRHSSMRPRVQGSS